MTKRNLTAAKIAAKPSTARKAARKPVPARRAGIRSALMLSTGALALFAAAPALAQTPDVNALPTGGSFVAGNGTINTPSGNHLQVDQTSSRGVINWNSFDIGQNAAVTFNQQAGNQSITVNRVVGSGAASSKIFGELTANGSIVVINGNGVVFGGTSNVNVGSLVATTSDVNDAAFMAGGNLNFFGPASTVGDISVLGGASITVADAGLAAFVGPRVSNAGTITARGGRVVLASGVGYTLDLAGDGLLEIGVGADSPMVTQAGQIFAEGGLIQISAATAAGLIGDVINVSGTLSVTSADLDDGVIVLSAGNGAGGAVNVASDLTVDGDISIAARRIRGAGDVNVTNGALALNLNVGGADTTGETLIADALAVIGTMADGTTLTLGAGDYRGGAVIASNNVTLAGTTGTRIVLPTLAQGQEMNGLTISADNVTIRDLAIVGPALNESWLNYAWNAPASGGTTRGIAVWNGADNFAITDSTIQGVRTGIVIDGRNAGGSVTGNIIDNTKSAISVQYTDAGLLNAEGFTFDISGNDDGQYGNEWGANFHLNGHLVGATPVANSVKIANTAASAVQAALLNWSAANGGMSAQDQGYNFANRTHVNVAVGGGANAQGSLLSAIGTLQGGVDAVVAGGFVNVANGTYVLSSTLNINTDGVSLIGQSKTGVLIDASGASTYGVRVKGDNVSLSGFTLTGGTGYGVKVEADGPNGVNERNTGFRIADVSINGSTKTGLDLNSVTGAVIDGVAVTNVSRGNGIAITDSANVTVRNTTTSGNAWGGLALYQANNISGGGSNQQLTGIVVEGSNSFGEVAGVYMQDSSALHDIGSLSITGFNHIVHQDPTSTVFQKTLADAAAFALTGAAGSSIEGWTGTGGNNDFNVVSGLKIQNAIRDARSGGTVNVAAGSYADTITINKALTLHGAGMEDTSLTGGITLSNTAFSNLTLQGFTLSGDGGGNALVRNGRVTNLTVDDVRFNGANVAGRHGFAGGQFGGAISITNSEFLGIRGFSAFDTSTGGTATAITSVNFSDNLLDGTVGHVTFRQATPTANVLISGNTVRNVGDTTDLSSGVFKVFGASTVDFVRNDIDGISGSPKLTAGVNDGAALLVRSVGTLNITDNIFSNNQQAFLVGAGNALPTVTNITGNTFANNAYDIFLPASTGGTINFGAGNEFISGADTQQHITWVGSAGLDLTGVSFDGQMTSEMSLAELFALEDRITHGTDIAGAGLATFLDGQVFVTQASGSIQRGVNVASSGDVVHVSAGVFNDPLSITKSVSVIGAGVGQTIIRPTTSLATGVGHKGDANMNVAVFVSGAGNVILDGLTIDGNNLNNNAAVFWTNTSGEIRNSHITNVRPFSGAQTGHGLAVDATGANTVNLLVSNVDFDNWNKNAIDAVTGQGATTGGGRINLTVNNGTTFTGRGDTGTIAQNGILLWERGGGTVNATLDGVTISDIGYTGANSAAGVLLYGVANGQLAVTNSAFDDVQTYVALSAGSVRSVDLTQGNSFDGVAIAGASLADLFAIEDRIDHGVDAAGNGLVTLKAGNLFVTPTAGNLSRAVGLASAGNTVNVAAGSYGDAVTINKANLTLAGAGMNATTFTNGLAITGGSAGGLTLRDFTVSGVGGSATVVRNSGTLLGLTVDGVRIDGDGVAGRHGLIGGQIGGAISIANSEFIDIRGWAAFDTRAGGGGGADVTSVNFSNNLLDGTVGHITFRQNAAVDVLISGNTVRNVGDTTELSSGIFKVFGAATVDFIGNSVTGVGASPSKFTAGVADGAALIVNNTATLNITDNVFTDNRQAFLVGAGNALPTTTNVTGNTFTNNAYDIFLPASTGGTLSFGAGNTFNSGANTMAHLVWVGATAVDMTGVTFDGALGSAMSNADLFALEDRIYHGVDKNGAGLVTVKAGNLFATPTAGNLNRAVNLASNGDTVNIANGTHNLGSTALIVDDSISLVGQSQAGTIIDGRGVGGGLGTMLVSADHVSLSNFTLYGADSGVNNFGIKVQPNPVTYATSQRLYDFSISDVTVQGSTRAELDLNGVVGAQITNFTANGYRVGTATETGGAGIQITDSQDVYLSGITTLGNAWGSVAIYQTNKAGAYDALTNNINIDGTNSNFGEFLGVFVESYSTLHPQIGELHLTGFGHTVRSPGHRAGGENFTFFRTTLADAINFAANLDAGSASSTSAVQGFDGSNGTGHYYVGTGNLLTGGTRNLSIQAAFNGSTTDGTIHVASGNYAETATLNGRRTLLFGNVGVTGLNLTSGADGSTLAGLLTAGAGGLNFASRIYLGDDLGLTATNGGAIALARVDGAHGLTVDGGSITLGAIGSDQALTGLDVEGVTIVTNGATTTGAQAYAGAVTLNGAYSASDVSALGAVTLAGNTSVNAGDVALGAVNGAHGLTVDAVRSVSLGRVGAATALTGLDVEGATIATNGATTTGAQAYAGAVTLNGAYSASDVSALGAVTLAGNTSVNAGDVALGAVNGAHGLTVDAVRSVSLGRVGATTALTGLDVEGATIATNGATTTGAQAYAGAVTLNGAYSASDVSVRGGSTLAGDTAITARNGAVLLGAVDGTSVGGQSLAVDAGNSTATVGSFGSKVRLGAVTLHAAQTVLQGNSYAGNSLAFTGGAGSTVRLTRVSTAFNTSQSNGAGGDILIQPHLIGTQSGAQNVVFIAGDGLSGAGGDITLGNAGTEDLRLGSMGATGDNFSAATVKLAADYTALLAGNQVFTDETLDTLGGVSARVAGNESGSIRALGPVFIQAGGSGTGSLIAGGAVTLNYGTGTDRVITSGGDVSVSSVGGPIAGSITSNGAVTINGGSQVSTTIVAGSNVGITTGGGISSDITAPGQVALDAGRNINVTVDAGTVVVNAPGGTVDGVFNGISTPGNATLIVNGQAVIGDGNAASRQILTDNFLVSAGGIVGSNGQIQLPVGLAIALIAPAGEGEGQRRPIIVNDIQRLGELLRLGYTAIVVQIDEGDEPAFEQELNLAEGESATPAA